jgi:diguanylate cyclase (GGDEF)-like protein
MLRKMKQLIRAVQIIFRLGIDEVVELQKRANHDPLTGIYNRWLLKEIAQKEIQRARRHKSSLSLVMVDVDNLKWINDHSGHLNGDKVLRNTANLLIRGCRRYDSIFRFGGDEFLILLPETDKEKGKQVVKRIKELAQVPVIPIQLSFGVASWREPLSLEDLIRKADAELYEDKATIKPR